MAPVILYTVQSRAVEQSIIHFGTFLVKGPFISSLKIPGCATLDSRKDVYPCNVAPGAHHKESYLCWKIGMLIIIADTD